LTTNLHILVDQFGYRPKDPKVAVIRSPRVGYDAQDTYVPGTHYEVRRVGDGKVMLSGQPTAWADGKVESSSGDQGWWFDFSSVVAPGRYVVVDADRRQQSPPFSIAADVYKDVLKAAVRTFFYQRSGFAKRQPYAEACWTDDAAYLGPNQDSEAHDVTDRDNSTKIRDMRGGWFDAGDTNKYVTFAVQPVHQLLTTYTDHPSPFTDDFGIPESGNGIPDLIDEIKWEVDWIKRMQGTDGGVALKLGEVVIAKASPPSSDHSARYYIPSCTSATIGAAGIFAHAAVVFRRFPALEADAADLQQRAVRAWDNFQQAPSIQVHCDTGVVHVGNADLSVDDQKSAAGAAAIYLFAATGDERFEEYLQSHYREMQAYRDIGWTRYRPEQGEALLFYASLPKAKPALRQAIREDKRKDVLGGYQIYGFHPDDDLYRSFLHDPSYHWGSNNPRANYGNTNLDVLRYRIEVPDTQTYLQRALETVHYFHGVNPLGMAYLTNMYALGATRSANEIFHVWYAHGSRWSDAKTSECGPPPGYVPGGPNANAASDGVPVKFAPPTGQPPQKSYKDWNGQWPENSWPISEPGIYYEAAYVRLLSAFVD